MRKIWLIFFIALAANNTSAQSYLEIRQKIIPLKSTRSSVEKIAKFIKDFDGYIRYETDNEFLNVYYTSAKCNGIGWNVPPGTVLFYNVYLKREVLLKDVLRRNVKIFEISDDIGTTHYIDPKEEIEFVVRAFEKKVEYIGNSPLETDNILRCKGFPKYDLISEHYSRFEYFTIENNAPWDAGKMIDTVVRVKENLDTKGYVFVYCKKGQLTKCNEIKKQIERVVKKVMNKDANRITVSVGGYRNDTEVETFLIPEDYPSVVARPTYPSNF